jgi:hypothetical protein
VRIECLCLLRPSAETCLGVVFIDRGGLRRGGDISSGEWGEGTSAGTRILPSTYLVRGQAQAKRSYG